MGTMVAKGTDTGVVVDPSTLAGTPIDTEVVGAFIGDAGLTIGTRPSWGARAGIRALSGIETGSPILAR